MLLGHSYKPAKLGDRESEAETLHVGSRGASESPNHPSLTELKYLSYYQVILAYCQHDFILHHNMSQYYCTSSKMLDRLL